VVAAGGGAIALKAGVGAPSARMQTDPTALTRVMVSGHGARLDSVHATGPGGAAIPVSVRDGRVFPTIDLPVGEKVVVTATISRSAPVSWVLGATLHLQRAVRTPKARIASRWLEVPAGSPVKLSFAAPVDRVSIRSGSHHSLRTLPPSSRSLTLPGTVSAASARTVLVAAAPRRWEILPDHVPVTWFAAGGLPKVVATPRPGAAGLGPGAVLRLTFSRPVSEIFGKLLPTLSPSTPGRWHQLDAHTLAFAPTGAGFGLDARIKVSLPRAVQLAGRRKGTRTLTWSGAAGSTLRLQQLLANLGFLPVQWAPSSAPVANTVKAQQSAAIDPPAGHFGWIWNDVPASLRSEWRPGLITPMTQGAIMAFQAQHGLEVDGFAGPIVWRDLIAATLSGTRNTQGYSYVLVRKTKPQSLTLWHDDTVLVNGPSNTGIPKAPTPDGTFPVYLRLRSQTMSGRNPDGTHYSDAGIKWISYFHAGEAIHGFDRTSYGSPQSLGCVELPVAEAARVWPYTPIGTLVTIAP
jgi:peptidoglycan hydrolase-like protein with peptidoglycan-binding domain